MCAGPGPAGVRARGFGGLSAGRSKVRWSMKAIALSRIGGSWPVTSKLGPTLRHVTSLSAVLLALTAGPVTAQAAPKDAAQTVQITEKARELFRTGVALLQD